MFLQIFSFRWHQLLSGNFKLAWHCKVVIAIPCSARTAPITSTGAFPSSHSYSGKSANCRADDVRTCKGRSASSVKWHISSRVETGVMLIYTH